MLRRDFLKYMMVMPLSGLADIKSSGVVIIDYSSDKVDEHGSIFRRTLVADKIDSDCVSKVKLLRTGSVEVISYAKKKSMVGFDGKFFVENKIGYISQICSDWKINCYDESGEVVKVLTKRDFFK